VSLLLALLTTAATLTGDAATHTTTALDAVAVPGSVSIEGAQATTTTTALDAVLSPGAATATGTVATHATTALDATALPSPVTITGAQGSSTTTALDGVATPGAVTLTGANGTTTTTALDGAAVPQPITITGGVASLTSTALDAVVGFPGPDADVYGLTLSITARGLEGVTVARGLSLSMLSRSLDGSTVARGLSLSIPVRSLVSSQVVIIKGDTERVPFTLTVASDVISSPLSGVLNLYALGSTTLVTSLTFTIDSGIGTASVVGHADFNAANTPVAGTYIAQVVLTYVDGPKTWPNSTPWTFTIRAPGAA